jgi:hypothetical protein
LQCGVKDPVAGGVDQPVTPIRDEVFDEVAHLPRFIRKNGLVDIEGEDLLGLDQLALQCGIQRTAFEILLNVFRDALEKDCVDDRLSDLMSGESLSGRPHKTISK